MTTLPPNGGFEIPAAERYLWDGTGPVDAAVARLEAALRPLRIARAMPEMEVVGRIVMKRAMLAAAAAVVLMVGGWMVWVAVRPGPVATTGWKVAMASGDAKVSEAREVKAPGGAKERSVETGKDGSVRVEGPGGVAVNFEGETAGSLIEELGGTRAAVLHAGRVFVEAGGAAGAECRLEAWKSRWGGATLEVKPGSAAMVEMEPGGGGQITVKSGEAAVSAGKRVVRMAGPAHCPITGEGGVGTPYALGAGTGLIDALAVLDGRIEKDPKVMKIREAALETVLMETTRTDAATLWNLIGRLQGGERGEVVDRFLHLVAIKADPGELQRLEPGAMEAAWKAVVGGR